MMLTKKELLKYKKQKDKLIPVFINPEDDLLKEFAEALCDLFASSHGKTRKEIEAGADELISAFDIGNIVAQGLKKLCFDLLTFESLLSAQTVEFREKVFNLSFSSCMTQSVEEYRDTVIKSLNENALLSSTGDDRLEKPQPMATQGIYTKEIVESFLYSDLPEFHKVTESKPMTPMQLLNKYNVSLVQGFLFYCSKIKITVSGLSQYKAQLRQLVKHIKFFQLVVYFIKKEDMIEIEIDGPLSLFVHTHKYGFNLACFFPALLLMPQWELVAYIEMGKEPRQCGELRLSHKTGLLSHYKNYSAYIPEEFKLFSESFARQSPCAWTLNEHCDDILFDGDNYFFPDFKFIHENGESIYLELFHPWHSAALKHRLSALQKKPPSFKLVLGVSKSLLKESAFAREVQQSPYFNQFSFTFRDVVLADKVLAALNSQLV